MKMNTYVNFSGTCSVAFRYYEKHLGAKVGIMMTHGQAPDQSRVNPEWKDAVLRARISIGDTELMAADIPNAEPMRSAYLTLRTTQTRRRSAFSPLCSAKTSSFWGTESQPAIEGKCPRCPSLYPR